MKKILLITLFLLGTYVTQAQSKSNELDIVYYYKDVNNTAIKDVIAKSLNEGKVPILYFYADWCAPCKKFSKAMKNKELKSAMKNATFIKINVDNDVADNGQAITSKYGIRLIPTFIKVDKDANVIARITSDKWDKDVPKEIAPVINDLINSDTYNSDK
ncbi:TlpA family protein disulfide reductase [Pseudofulvibacter geojedonensis]|uniref:TlpA family protein disulfide reductase n=1 Tax=Pseudofulvibacter geojedonensis TaxID=1123758 RepID=A0ABW3I2R2_9FLAO